MYLLKFAAWVFVGMLLVLPAGLRAAEWGIDFETQSPDLAGWSGTTVDAERHAEYRTAPKWDVPMVIRLVEDRPHLGAKCLQWNFTQSMAGMASMRPPFTPVSDREVLVRFYMRTKGFSGEGIFSVDEMKTEKERVKTNWNAAKLPLADDWVKVEWKGVLDPATQFLRIAFTYTDAPAGASFWLDDLTVSGIVGDYR